MRERAAAHDEDVSAALSGSLHRGRCACGRTGFAASDPPVWAAYCHCADCRSATGAPFALWVGFRTASVTILGSPTWRDGAASSVARGFCPACGAPFGYRDETIAGEPEIYLAIGLFDAPERIVPQAHAFWRSKLPFVVVTDDLPRHDTFSRGRVSGRKPPPHMHHDHPMNNAADAE